VRGFTVPVRALTLRELSSNAAERLSIARTLFNFNSVDAETSSLWSIAVNVEALAALWRMYLESVLRPVLVKYCKMMLGEDCERGLSDVRGEKLVIYLEGLADILAYAMRYPLYRDPFASFIEGGEAKENPLVAPHVPLLAARLSYVARRLQGKDAEKSRERYREMYLAELLEPVTGIAESGVASIVSEVTRTLASYAWLAELLFYATPADTRPGFNTTSLFAHLLLVSGVAATALGSVLDKHCIDRALVRLAGLLHDIGKPLDYSRHVEKSAEEARRLLEGLVPRNVLNAVIALIRAHHGGAVEAFTEPKLCMSLVELRDFLRCADSVAAQLDRLAEVVAAALDGRLGVEKEREALLRLGEALAGPGCGGAEDAIRGLYRLPGAGHGCRPRIYAAQAKHLDALIKASEALARLFASLDKRRLMREAGVFDKEMAISTCRGASERVRQGFLQLRLYVVDIGGVQAGLSESYKLRSLAGFSLLVDQLTMSGVPGALLEAGAVLEGIVFSGGGTIHALIAGSEEETRRHIYRALKDMLYSSNVVALALHGLRVRVGSAALTRSPSRDSVLSRNYALVVGEAYQRLEELQLSAGSGYSVLYSLLTPLGAKCSSCGVRPAVLGLGEDKLCPVCAAKYLAADGLSYSEESVRAHVLSYVKVGKRSLVDVVFRERYGRVSGGIRLMELLAGDYLPGMGSMPNYAIIKSDGNAAGAFMSLSLTPAMFFERSVRLDMATKKAIGRIASLLRSNCRRELEKGRDLTSHYCMSFASFVLGFLYAGGDDSLLIVPARIALPSAALLVYEFSAELGFHASLSAGVAAAPVKHNVWWTLSAANALLDDVAKPSARPVSIEALRSADRVKSAGYVAFEYSDGWGLLAVRALQRYEERRRLHRSLQPLPVLPPKQGDLSLLELLALAAGEDLADESSLEGPPSSSEQDKSIRLRLERVLAAFLEGRAAENMWKLHASLSRAVSPAAEPQENLLRIIYYSVNSSEDIVKRAAGILARVYASRRGVLPLDDIYLVYKYARGD